MTSSFEPMGGPTSSPDAMASAGLPSTSSLVAAGAIHPGSWSARRLRDHAADIERGPWQTLNADLARRVAATAQAMHEAWPHLDVEHILSPPRGWFDAALARHVVVWVLNKEMRVNRRVLAAMSLLSRESIHRATRTVEHRLATPAFATLVEGVTTRAQALHLQMRTRDDG